LDMMGLLFKAHPWHGVSIGEKAPDIVTTYIEIVPTDTVKYELDKATGNLKVDRPQRFSNVCPTLYGFIPQTYCGDRVGQLCAQRTMRKSIKGDGDPMDICVLAERPITHGNILLRATPIGGLRMIDGEEADDKIISVMIDDPVHGGWRDIGDCPPMLIERLQHYFLTYKMAPGETTPTCEITDVYGADEAHDVINRSHQDYLQHFSHVAYMLKGIRDVQQNA
jgi:inorganic pyrophosphatase